MWRAWLVFAVIAMIGGVARAQIVNVQGALAKAPPEDGITAQLEVKLNWREGNNPLFDVGGAGTVLVRRGRILGLALARGEYGVSRGLTLIQKIFEHVRVRVELDERWRWEVFGQHEYDEFRRLALRALTGTGPVLQVVDTKPVAVLVGASYMLEHERLDERAGTADAGTRTTAHRASFYVTGRESVGTGVTIIETVYAQPRIDEPDDLRLLGEFAVLAKLSERVSLKNSLTVAYDRTPPDGVKGYDTSLEVAVQLTF
jgi:hypothetical protein